MTTAFVLSGGGSLGAVQVGMLRALTRHGIRADVVVGTSVGAGNGFSYAAKPDADGVEQMAEMWLELADHEVTPFDPLSSFRAFVAELPWNPVGGLLRAVGLRNHVFPFSPVTTTLAALGLRNHVVSTRNLERFSRSHAAVERLEQAVLPVHLMTADVLSGRQVSLSSGPAEPAVRASSAIPAVFPNVTVDGRILMDGGITANTAIDQALALGADRIYVLPCGFSCGLTRPPRTVLEMGLHAFNLILEQRLVTALDTVGPPVELLVVPPLCPVTVSPVDFSQSASLIERAFEATGLWLTNGYQAIPGLSRSLSTEHAHDDRAHHDRALRRDSAGNDEAPVAAVMRLVEHAR